MIIFRNAFGVCLLAATGSALAQSGGTLSYGPAAGAAGATPVPLPSLLLLPLGIALAFLGYRALQKNGLGSALGALLVAAGLAVSVSSGLNIQKAIAAAMIELNQPEGGTVDIPAGDAIYTNTSGVALEIGTVVAPPACATTAPADECVSGLVLEDTQSCSTVYDCTQTISFTSAAPVDAMVGDEYMVAATATSGLAVTFSTASAACNITGAAVTFEAVGDCVINADQPGDADYDPAPQQQQIVMVGKAEQSISFTSTVPGDAAVDGADYAVTAEATSGLEVTLGTNSTTCSVSGNIVSFIAAGDCVIDAEQAGNADFQAAPPQQQVISVAKGEQTIQFSSTAPVDAVYDGPGYEVTADASSGLEVTFSTSGDACTVAGNTVSFTGVGQCTLNADQPGNENYLPAPQASQLFPVAKATPSLAFTSNPPGDATVEGATYMVTAESDAVQPILFSSTSMSICTVSGATVSFLAAGTCMLEANQAANDNYNSATATQQVAVGKASQTISFTSTAPGSATVGDSPYVPAATASSGLAVTFSTSGSACSLSAGQVNFIGAGSCVINANQAGNDKYLPAPQVQQTIPVAAAPVPVVVEVTKTNDGVEATVPTSGAFTFRRTGATSSPLTVKYSLGGTALRGFDYTVPSSSQIQIPAGADTAELVFSVLDDRKYEDNESVNIRLLVDAAYSVGAQNSAEARIIANDKMIFATDRRFDGNLQRSRGADGICREEAAALAAEIAKLPEGERPLWTATGTYKALVADSLRSASPPLNWVLEAGARYFKPDQADRDFVTDFVAEANAARVFDFPIASNTLSGPFGDPSLDVSFWTGLNADWTNADENCVSFFNDEVAMGRTGAFGSATKGTNLISNGSVQCDARLRLHCVEQ